MSNTALERISRLFGDLYTNAVFDAMALYGSICRKQYLKDSAQAEKTAKRRLMRLIRRNANTAFGKAHRFDEIHSIEDYRKHVPYTSYEDYASYIDQTMEYGTQGLMTASEIKYFANTSGTTGVTKHIPVTRASYVPYRRCASIIVAIIKEEVKNAGLRRPFGRGLNLVEAHSVPTPSGIRNGYISGYALSSLKGLVAAITCIPIELYISGTDGTDAKYLKARYALQDPDLVFMMGVFMSALTDLMSYIEQNHELLIRDIELGTIDPSIEMPDDLRKKLERKLRPNPTRAEELREIFADPKDGPLVPRIWKRMSAIVAIGCGEFSPYVVKMRGYTGNAIPYGNAMYASSEALIANTLRTGTDEYLLLPDSGFYEFIAVDDESKAPLTVGQLEVGKEYELIVTNLAGLWRYRIHDVVRVASLEGQTPYLQFCYRDQQVINIAGMHLSSEHVANAIMRLAERLDVAIEDYSFYSNDGVTPSRVDFFIEFGDEAPHEDASPLLDACLNAANDDYGIQLDCGDCAPCVIHPLPLGTYNAIRQKKIDSGIPVNQIKPIRQIKTEEQFQEFLGLSMAGSDR